MSASSTQSSDLPLPLEWDADWDRDAVDPELLALPDPPKGERRWTVALLATTAAASLAMAVMLAPDARYAFASPDAVSLGELANGVNASAPLGNHFVEGRGLLGGTTAVRYERLLESDSYRIARIAGPSNVWVEFRVPYGQESSRYVPKGEFQGRLVRFKDAGIRHRGLQSAIREASGKAVGDTDWLLVDGETPGAARGLVALVVLFLGFAVWNVFGIRKLVRPVRD